MEILPEKPYPVHPKQLENHVKQKKYYKGRIKNSSFERSGSGVGQGDRYRDPAKIWVKGTGTLSQLQDLFLKMI